MFSPWILERIAIGETHRLRTGITTMGRHSMSTIRIVDSGYVSRHHAEIVISNDSRMVTITDLGSVNGVYVNSLKHQGTTVKLQSGDKVGIGIATHGNQEANELTHPIYELKFQPLPSTSKAAASIESKPKILPGVFVISDSDDSDEEEKPENGPQHNFKHLDENQTDKPAIQNNDPEIIEFKEENEINKSKSNTLNPIDDNTANGKDTETAKDKPAHIPIISSVKKELIHTVSENVKDIFGNIQDDDEMKNKLKEMNPFVYNELTGNPLLPVTNINKYLHDGDLIDLSDDDTIVEDDLGCIITSSEVDQNHCKDRIETSKSPNLFDSSLNDSIEEDNINEEEVAAIDNNATNPDEILHTSTDGVALDTYISKESNTTDEDFEELMFSQALMNDMKAELQNDDFDTEFDDVPDSDGRFKSDLDLTLNNCKEEQNLLPYEMRNSSWVISDDEDFDEELETKVTDWANKIFSQSFSNSHMSQVYDIDTPNSSNDEEENDEENSGECDIIGDFYNRHADESETTVDIEEVLGNFKDQLKSFNEDEDDEENDRSKEIIEDNANVIQKDFEKNVIQTSKKDFVGVELEVDKECRKLNSIGTRKEKDINENIAEISTKNNCKFVAHERNEKTAKAQEIVNSKSPEKLHQTSDIDSPLIRVRRKSLSITKGLASSSEEDDAKKLHRTSDIDSPLIRARRKSLSSTKRLASSSEEEENEDNFVPDKAKYCPQSVKKDNPCSTPRQLPILIDAPSLPKCKGKLRGVSAVKQQPSHENCLRNVSKEKTKTIRDQIVSDGNKKELKRKWVEKPSVRKNRDKEREEIIKASRKDKLKELAAKQKEEHPIGSQKRKSSKNLIDEECRAKKAKVKVTTSNRGAFLVNAAEQTKPKSKCKFKIPKIEEKKKETNDMLGDVSNAKAILKRCHSVEELKKKEPPKRTTSIDVSFSQQIQMTDELLLKKKSDKKSENKPQPAKVPAFKSNSAITNNGYCASSSNSSTICKDAVAARALRTTNKVTFASMEKNHKETKACEEKLDIIWKLRSIERIPSILSKPDKAARSKKTVRFNDTPVVHYIERICGAIRKVTGKDILPQTTYKDRRIMIRQNYPILDNTNKIISKMLQWGNEWLVKRDATADAASEVVYPMPTHFSSFEHYKSILFPLMKLEFASLLEQGYKSSSSKKKYNVKLEYFTENKDRLMLITKFYFTDRQQLESTKFDLVILESKEKKIITFAYVTAVRKGAGSCNTMVFEILTANKTKENFTAVKKLIVRPVIDNIRVEFGAFNSVYQLETTPLFKKILNPLDLLQCRHSAKKKPIYRGCDALNEKQTQVLLNTYLRIIDETSPTISLMQGPPGTGKSCVITNLALQTLYGDEVRYLDKKILSCAQSNAAVDVIASKLYNISMRMRPVKRFQLIRYGLPDKIKPGLHPVSLIHMVEKELLRKLQQANENMHVDNKENLKHQILELETQIADMLKRNVSGTVEQDTLLEKQRQLKMMRNISQQLTRPEDERNMYKWYLSNANVVCATLSSCVKLSQFVDYFDICIIDEATQCTEPWTLLPLRFGINSLVLVGDTQQLPATILSKKAYELGLGKSMFSRIQNCLENVSSVAASAAKAAAAAPSNILYSLQTQYRMHPEICRWPNKYFYKNELINGRITKEYNTPLVPFSVLNLAYSQNEYCTNGKINNNMEAEFVAKLLKALDGLIPNKYNSYGVITPYAHHRTTLENSIRSFGLTNIMVNTIDSYQGLEKDVIVISNARTTGIGFLSNPQRLNVALTRPRKCLILCGNFKSLEIVPAWRYLLQSARERNLYHEISEKCVDNIQGNVIDKIRLKN